MIDTIELQPLKSKFASLISRLYTDAKFPIENINESLIRSDLLDCFENNHPEIFLRMSIEEMSEKLGAGKIKFSEERNEELYWSGLQYMNIFFNKMIPLKQLLLLVPINSMIDKFKIYHEINDIEVLKAFDSFSKTNILKSLRKQSGKSIRELSYLTDIPENSLKRYEKSNNFLFNASFENIHSLRNYFKVDSSMFRNRTAFIPYSIYLWNDNNFTTELKKQICLAFKIGEEETLILRESDSLNEALKKNKRTVVVEPLSFLYTVYSDRVLKKHLDTDIMLMAIYKSIIFSVNNSDSTNMYF